MQSTVLVMPISPGRSEAVRTMFSTIKNEKWKDFERVRKNAGIEKEQYFLQTSPQGDLLTIYIESDDLQKTFSYLASTRDTMDVWFAEELKKNTGLDLNLPLPPMPQLLISYHRGLAGRIR